MIQHVNWCFLLSGEFTLRAFLNGRLDLSQAENVERLITAKSVAAADAALAGIQACQFHNSTLFSYLTVDASHVSLELIQSLIKQN